MRPQSSAWRRTRFPGRAAPLRRRGPPLPPRPPAPSWHTDRRPNRLRRISAGRPRPASGRSRSSACRRPRPQGASRRSPGRRRAARQGARRRPSSSVSSGPHLPHADLTGGSATCPVIRRCAPHAGAPPRPAASPSATVPSSGRTPSLPTLSTPRRRHASVGIEPGIELTRHRRAAAGRCVSIRRPSAPTASWRIVVPHQRRLRLAEVRAHEEHVGMVLAPVGPLAEDRLGPAACRLAIAIGRGRQRLEHRQRGEGTWIVLAPRPAPAPELLRHGARPAVVARPGG